MEDVERLEENSSGLDLVIVSEGCDIVLEGRGGCLFLHPFQFNVN